jgi:hypothetical protein
MSTTDCATDTTLNALQTNDNSLQCDDNSQLESLDAASEAAAKPVNGLLFGFAASVTIGLALASWYLGVRIVSENKVPPPTVSQAISSVPAPAAIAAPVSIYLQVGSLGSKEDAGFVRSLETQGFRVHLQASGSQAPGSQDADTRILIGPFATHQDMEQVRDKLASSGVLAIEMSN